MSINRVGHLLDEPQLPAGTFSEYEAQKLFVAYRKDPSSVLCPRCGPGTIEVLAFIEPGIDTNGLGTVTEPQGVYAVAIYCHKCRCALGLLSPFGGNQPC